MSERVRDGQIVSETKLTDIFRGYTYTIKNCKVKYPQIMLDQLLFMGQPEDIWVTGYVKIPDAKQPGDLVPYEDLYCYGGIGYMGKLADQSGFWIGFDCNHNMNMIAKKDINFAVSECKLIIMQLLDGNGDLESLYRIN